MGLLEFASVAKRAIRRAISLRVWQQPPSVSKRFVVLAHSIKYAPGRCIAGREISTTTDGGIVPGSWIRPVSKHGKGELLPDHYRLESKGFAQMLDIVEVPFRAVQNDATQPENWFIDTSSRWSRVGSLPLDELEHFVETPPNLWLQLNCPTDRVSAEYLAKVPPKQSLYFLRLPESVVRPTESRKPGFRLHFTYNGIAFRLKITDPLAIGLYTEQMIGRTELRLRDATVCISLGSPFEGYHYKLVASITQPLAQHTLFTIGHSSRSIEEFIDILNQHGIDAIADVRSRPYSSRFPHFSRRSLQESLHAAGIHYVFLGNELGARRDDPEAYVNRRVSYARIAQTDAFQEGIERVIKGIERYRIVLMCAEKDPLTCHRTILVSRHLNEYGLNIVHILDGGQTETHSAAERRLATEERINSNQLGLAGGGFDNVAPLDRAYTLREEKIAFRLGESTDEDLHDRVYSKIR